MAKSLAIKTSKDFQKDISKLISTCEQFCENVTKNVVKLNEEIVNTLLQRAFDYSCQLYQSEDPIAGVLLDKLRAAVVVLVNLKGQCMGTLPPPTESSSDSGSPQPTILSSIIPSLAKQLSLAFPGLTMDPKTSDEHDKSKLDCSSLNSTFNGSLSLIPLSECEPSPLKLTKDNKDFVGTPEKYYSVEDFIELVKATPFLYDKYHRLYRDSHIKDVRWAEIGSRYGMSGPQMVKKWTHIRDRYKRILNEVMVRQARGEHFQPSWKFFDVLHGMLCKNYSAANISVQSPPKPQGPNSPGASPITTINFANAAQLYTAALHQAAMNQSLNASHVTEASSEKDEIIAADFMVAETHIEEDHTNDGENDRENDRDDAASMSSGADLQSHHSLNSHKENKAPSPAPVAQKRSSDSVAEQQQPTKKRKNSNSTSDQDSGCETTKEEKDFIDHFINYIGERIRTHDKVQQLYVVNKIHQALFDFEMELAKP